MNPHRHLLAVLLVVVYGVVSAFGMSFVICVEGDGSQNVEALGAACCAREDGSPPAASGDVGSVAPAQLPREDCDDCQAHLPAFAIATTRLEESRPDAPTPVLLPATAWATASPFVATRGSVLPRPLVPPRPPPTLACLRSVVILC